MPVTIQEVSVESIPEPPGSAAEPSNGDAGRSKQDERELFRQWARGEEWQREMAARVHAH